MDVAAFLQSLTPLDILLILLFFGAFVLGYFEGGGRALLATLALAFSFILAANLRAPLGDQLGHFWTQFSTDYTLMLAFLISFVVAIVVSATVIKALTRRQALLPNSTVLDPVLGGTIAVIITVLILTAVIADLDTVYRFGPGFSVNDVPLLGTLQQLLAGSAIGKWIESTVVPIVTTFAAPLIPDEFLRLIRG
ncbi:MAG: CvpA family protein [Candidatus Limnocylindrales bacterium]